MKRLIFTGTSLDDLRAFPVEAKQQAGYQLDRVQHGLEPNDWKPMATVGLGVKEIRIHANGEFRVIYVAKFSDAVYVLAAFQKKQMKTPKHQMNLAQQRYAEMVNDQR